MASLPAEKVGLGRLEPVELRSAWISEATSFTPWLAEAENLGLLAETLGLNLEVESREQPVGPFRADILCKELDTGSWVLIENQIERTDHTHLGQILTYAAGLQAAVIVWVSARFTDEHRAALDWLNTITQDGFAFFGVEVELWRIGDFPPAPRFNVVSKPNTWSRAVAKSAQRAARGDPEGIDLNRVAYWSAFTAALEVHGGSLKPKREAPRLGYYSFTIDPKKNCYLYAFRNVAQQRIGVYLSWSGDFSQRFFGNSAHSAMASNEKWVRSLIGRKSSRSVDTALRCALKTQTLLTRRIGRVSMTGSSSTWSGSTLSSPLV